MSLRYLISEACMFITILGKVQCNGICLLFGARGREKGKGGRSQRKRSTRDRRRGLLQATSLGRDGYTSRSSGTRGPTVKSSSGTLGHTILESPGGLGLSIPDPGLAPQGTGTRALRAPAGTSTSRTSARLRGARANPRRSPGDWL